MELVCKFSLEDDFSSSMYSLSVKLLNFFVQSLEMILSTLKSVSSDNKVNLSQKFSLLVLEKPYRNGCTQMGYVTIQNPFIVAAFQTLYCSQIFWVSLQGYQFMLELWSSQTIIGRGLSDGVSDGVCFRISYDFRSLGAFLEEGTLSTRA